MTDLLTSAAAVAVAIFGLLHLLLHWIHDGREPPIAPTTIPFFGHVIGMTQKKSGYYVKLRNKYHQPIYTLHLPGTRIYVVNSPSLIPVVQKQTKTLSFAPVEGAAAKGICGTSKIANDILDANVNGDDGPWSYSVAFHSAIRKPLSSGAGLDAMNRVMASKVAASIDGMSRKQQVKLFAFVKHEVTFATTESVYGPQNPFRRPEVEQAFWDFQPGIMIMLMKLLPSVFARDSLAARDTITKAFLKYFNEGGHRKGSALIQARFDVSTEYKIPLEDIARFECGGAVGILTNNSPICFWMLYHVYSDDIVLNECRQEVAKFLSDEPVVTSDGKKKTVRTLNMTSLKHTCPVLLSTFQEVLRMHTIGVAARLVMEDHLLDGKYLLKKGSTLLIPGSVQHTSSASFGSNVDSFDHRRFLPGVKAHNPVAFRSFGGGATLCPGRHFATTEILGFTALMILRCDVLPRDGKWVCPTALKAGLWETIPMPDFDIDVTIAQRADADESLEWRVMVTDSDKDVKISVDDM